MVRKFKVVTMKIVTSKKEYIKRDSLAKHDAKRPSSVKPSATKKVKTGYECRVIDLGDGYFKRLISKKERKK